MTTTNNLDHSGNFSKHPFAELLVEILHAKLSGSLRMSRVDQKAIVYFRRGEVVYGVSNSKSLRLFNLLLRKNRINARAVSSRPNFANDLEFSASLVSDGLIPRDEMNEFLRDQVEQIVIDLLTWPDGEWTFSPLVRLRDEMVYAIDVHKTLIDYARCVPSQYIFERFKSIQEGFSRVPANGQGAILQPHESAVLVHFDQGSLTVEQLREVSSMPETGLYQALYVLWLGGLLRRCDWNVAFSATKVGEILTARIARVKSAADTVAFANDSPEPPKAAEEKSPEPVKLPTVEISLEDYLKQIESSDTHYDTLGIETDADLTSIKQAYFSLAKQFHPDRHHRESADTLRRIQSAFTVLAHAHETLRSSESREAYDLKVKRDLEAREKRRAAGQPDIADPTHRNAELGLEAFEEGLSMLNEEEYEAASAYLARAVHYSPENPLFHAYLGKALSATDDKYKHKAETSFQTAVKLDPKNSNVRLMFVEFLLDQKMAKRAEGELKRFLELVPNSKEAMAMYAKIKQ